MRLCRLTEEPVKDQSTYRAPNDGNHTYPIRKITQFPDKIIVGDLGCFTRLPNPGWQDPGSLNRGSKKAPNPGSGYATLDRILYNYFRELLRDHLNVLVRTVLYHLDTGKKGKKEGNKLTMFDMSWQQTTTARPQGQGDPSRRPHPGYTRPCIRLHRKD